MATDAENMATVISNLLAYLATESANPKPSYSIDGQSVSWDQHRASIMQQIREMQDMAAGPFEVQTEYDT